MGKKLRWLHKTWYRLSAFTFSIWVYWLVRDFYSINFFDPINAVLAFFCLGFYCIFVDLIDGVIFKEETILVEEIHKSGNEESP